MAEGTVSAAPAAAPAPAAATSAPASSAPAPVAAPASVEAPAAAAPVAGDGGASPAVPAGGVGADGLPVVVADPAPGGKAEPKQEDFPGDVAGFLDAHNAWERGDEVEPKAGDAPAVEGETKPAEGETKPEDAETQVDPDAPWAPEPETSLTPEAFNALIGAKPERSAFLDADPELKNAMFAMARTNAKLEPLGKIFPNKESAEFAAQAAGTMVSLRTNFLEAVDNPEQFPTAYEQFADEFAIKDKDGKPVLDAGGNPTYGDDFQMLNDFIVDTYHGVEIQDLEAQLQAGAFKTDEQREQADMALQAFKFIKDWKAGKTNMDKPDLSGLSPEAKAYYEQKEAELAAREEALGTKSKTQTAEQKKQERANYETAVARKVGASVGSRIKTMISEREKNGAFVPSYILEAKDPTTGISVFAKTMIDQFEEATYGRVDRATGKVIGGVAYIRDQAKMLARRPPSPEAEQARVDFVNQLIDEHFPSIFDKNLRSIQTKEKEDRQRRQGSAATREQLAAREPRAGGGTSTSPKSVTPEAAMAEAYKWVDQNFPDADPRERTHKALMKKDELVGAR
jgi:hypothetical protein